jgi:hypothetical protein
MGSSGCIVSALSSARVERYVARGVLLAVVLRLSSEASIPPTSPIQDPYRVPLALQSQRYAPKLYGPQSSSEALRSAPEQAKHGRSAAT